MTSERAVVPERMDAPGLDVAAHAEALEGLGRLNRAAGAARAVARPMAEMARREGLKTISVLDVACGGGDVPVGVARILRKRGVQTALTLSDRSGTALGQAARRAAGAGIEVKTMAGEAPTALPEGEWDVVTNSLFLHHLERGAVVGTLRQMKRRARRMVVISDLRRSAMGLALAWAACRLLSRSEIVRHDGPVSVRAAWTMEELRGMAREAGMEGAQVRRSWPWRMLLVWRRGGEA